VILSRNRKQKYLLLLVGYLEIWKNLSGVVQMLNRTGKFVASATLITVSTLAFSSAALVRGQSNLNANKIDFGLEPSSMSFLSNRFNSSLPKIADLSKPNALFGFCATNGCFPW
jgi:hypothetical protein